MIFLSKCWINILIPCGNHFGKNYERFYRIKEAVHDLSDEDLNDIAIKIESIPNNKRTLTSVFKAAVYKKPSLIIDVMRAFTGV